MIGFWTKDSKGLVCFISLNRYITTAAPKQVLRFEASHLPFFFLEQRQLVNYREIANF